MDMYQCMLSAIYTFWGFDTLIAYFPSQSPLPNHLDKLQDSPLLDGLSLHFELY